MTGTLKKVTVTSAMLWRGVCAYKADPEKFHTYRFRHDAIMSMTEADCQPRITGRKNTAQGMLSVPRYLLGSAKPCVQFAIESSKKWKVFVSSSCDCAAVSKAAKQKALAGFFVWTKVKMLWVGCPFIFEVTLPFVPAFMADENKNILLSILIDFAILPENKEPRNGGSRLAADFEELFVF